MAKRWLVITVTGVTGGGKSNLCTNLFQNLTSSARLLHQDDYLPLIESKWDAQKKSYINWETISTINMNKMVDDVQEILNNPPNWNKMDHTYFSNTASLDVCKAIGSISSQNTHEDDLPGTFSLSNSDKIKSTHYFSDGCCTSICANSDVASQKCPVLILDGFTLLDDSRILKLTDKAFFFTLSKEVCLKRRNSRNFNTSDIPGYFDAYVWPMYKEYKNRCKLQYDKKVSVIYLDGEDDGRIVFNHVLHEVQKLTTSI